MISNILSVSTSSSHASLAIISQGKCLAEASNSQPRTHSDWIHQALLKCLHDSDLHIKDLQGLAIDVGPGSFTGIRVGLNLVKSMAFAQSLPIFQFSSLDILLSEHMQNAFALINAFKNSVFFAGQDSQGQPIPPQVQGVKQLVEWLTQYPNPESVSLLGDGLVTIPSLKQLVSSRPFLRPSSPEGDFPSAKQLGLIASQMDEETWTKDWKSVLPLYLRASEAEENLGKSKSNP